MKYIILFIIFIILIFIIKKKEIFNFSNIIDLIEIKNGTCQAYDINENTVRTGMIDDTDDKKCKTYGLDNNLIFPEVKVFNKGNYAIIDPFRNNKIWKLTEEFNIPNFTNVSLKNYVVGGEDKNGNTQYLCYARVTNIPNVTDITSSPTTNDISNNSIIPGIMIPSENSTCDVVLKDTKGDNLYRFPNFKLLKTSNRSTIPNNAYLTSLYEWKKVNNINLIALNNLLLNKNIPIYLIPQVDYDNSYRNNDWYTNKIFYNKPLLEYNNFDQLTQYGNDLMSPNYKIVEQIIDKIDYYINTYGTNSLGLKFTVITKNSTNNFNQLATIVIDNNDDLRNVSIYRGTDINGVSNKFNIIKYLSIPIIQDMIYFEKYKDNNDYYKNCLTNQKYIQDIRSDLQNNIGFNISDLQNPKIVSNSGSRSTLLRISEQIYDLFNYIHNNNFNVQNTKFYVFSNTSIGILSIFLIDINSIDINNKNYNITVKVNSNIINTPIPSGASISFNVFDINRKILRYIPLTSWNNYINIIGGTNNRPSITSLSSNNIPNTLKNYYNNITLPTSLVTIDNTKEITNEIQIGSIIRNLYNNRVSSQIKDFIKYYLQTYNNPTNISFITYTDISGTNSARTGYIKWDIESSTQVKFSITSSSNIFTSGSLSGTSPLINIDPSSISDINFRELIEIRLINYSDYLYNTKNSVPLLTNLELPTSINDYTYRYKKDFYENKMSLNANNNLYKITMFANNKTSLDDELQTVSFDMNDVINIYGSSSNLSRIYMQSGDKKIIAEPFNPTTNNNIEYSTGSNNVTFNYRVQINEWISYYFYINNKNLNKYTFVFVGVTNITDSIPYVRSFIPLSFFNINTDTTTTSSIPSSISISNSNTTTITNTFYYINSNIELGSGNGWRPKLQIYNQNWYNTNFPTI